MPQMLIAVLALGMQLPLKPPVRTAPASYRIEQISTAALHPNLIGGDGSPPHEPPDDHGRGRGDGDDGDRRREWLLPSTAWAAYTALLEEHPLPVKALTAGLVGGLGDLVAQRLTHSGGDFDLQRNLGVWLDGICVSGPGLHLGYAWLERRIPCANRGSLRNAVAQVAVDELVFDPIFIGTFFFTTGLVERQHLWRETLPNLRRQYWPTLRGAVLTSALFTPVQLFSFRYLPVQTRVLVVNTCDVLWYAAVSLGRHAERAPGGAEGRTAAC